MAAGIVRNGEVIYANYAGLADLPTHRPIDARTRFNLASNGKQFTALAILLLAEEHKLALTDDIRRYLPGLFPDLPAPITIQQLLTHTSGIRDVYDLWALQGITWWQKTFDNADALRLLHRQRELNFRPGSGYLYSNSNYILLAEIAAKAAGHSFAAYTNEVFRRLLMPDTSFEPDYRRIRAPIARPYFNFDSWTTYRWRTNLHGDGNLFSTLADQLQWEKVVQRGGDGLMAPVLIASSQALTGSAPNQPYGYGLEFGTYQALPYRFHEGATGAWKATTIRFADPNLALLTLTNSGKTIPARQTRQMADVVLPRNPAPEAPITAPAAVGDSVAMAALVGVYQNESDFWFRFEQRPAGLFLIRSGRNDVQLERAAANIFQQATDPQFKLAFTRSAQGELQVTAYHTSHAPYTLTRPAANWAGVDFSAWNGRYRNAETGAVLTIRYQQERTYRVRLSKQKIPAVLVTPQRLLADSYALALADANTVLLTSERIQHVRFTRVRRR